MDPDTFVTTMHHENAARASTCIITLSVLSGHERIRESLAWRLGHGFPDFRVVASDGARQFRLRSRVLGAQQVADVRVRLERMVARINEYHPHDVPLEVEMRVEE